MATTPQKQFYQNVRYSAVFRPQNTFKNPRQKMWGVFVANSGTGNIKKWSLCYASDDFRGAKTFYNSFLQDPQQDDMTLIGTDNIIMIEILPVNSNTRV